MTTRFRATAVAMAFACLTPGCATPMSPLDAKQEVQKLVGTWVGRSMTHRNDRVATPTSLARTLYIRRVWQADGLWKADAFYGNSGTPLPPVNLELYTGSSGVSLKFRNAANDIVTLTLVSDTRLKGAVTWVWYVQNNAGNDFALVLDRFDTTARASGPSTAATESQVRKLLGGWQGEFRVPTTDPQDTRRSLYIHRVWLEDGRWMAEARYGITGRGQAPVDLEIAARPGGVRIQFRTPSYYNVVQLDLVDDQRLRGTFTVPIDSSITQQNQFDMVLEKVW